mmetsp:Transcript_15941/g.49549  ORF Transcript_15941/g.49549 Transcript_15941/m.49549 type:complete len:293 (-) Transcript_15941:311-1189(-)
MLFLAAARGVERQRDVGRLAQARQEGAVHGGRVMPRGGLACEEEPLIDVLGQDVVVIARRARGHVRVRATCQRVGPPARADGLQRLRHRHAARLEDALELTHHAAHRLGGRDLLKSLRRLAGHQCDEQRAAANARVAVEHEVHAALLGALVEAAESVHAVAPEGVGEEQRALVEQAKAQPADGTQLALRQRRVEGHRSGLEHAQGERDDRCVGAKTAAVVALDLHAIGHRVAHRLGLATVHDGHVLGKLAHDARVAAGQEAVGAREVVRVVLIPVQQAQLLELGGVRVLQVG